MSPGTRWILIVVGLLVGNLVAAVVLIVASTRADAQVIPNYYQEATRYDDKLAEARRSQALAWAATATLVDGTLEVSVRDAAGRPLAGATVHAAGYQRARARERYDLDLAPGAAGAYRAAVTGVRAGVHDVTIVVERDGQRFTDSLVVEAR